MGSIRPKDNTRITAFKVHRGCIPKLAEPLLIFLLNKPASSSCYHQPLHCSAEWHLTSPCNQGEGFPPKSALTVAIHAGRQWKARR